MGKTIEDILASKGRLRLLKALLKREAANINTLIKDTGLPHRLVSKYVKDLVEAGLALERRYERLRIIEIDYTNPKTLLLKELLLE